MCQLIVVLALVALASHLIISFSEASYTGCEFLDLRSSNYTETVYEPQYLVYCLRDYVKPFETLITISSLDTTRCTKAYKEEWQYLKDMLDQYPIIKFNKLVEKLEDYQWKFCKDQSYSNYNQEIPFYEQAKTETLANAFASYFEIENMDFTNKTQLLNEFVRVCRATAVEQMLNYDQSKLAEMHVLEKYLNLIKKLREKSEAEGMYHSSYNNGYPQNTPRDIREKALAVIIYDLQLAPQLLKSYLESLALFAEHLRNVSVPLYYTNQMRDYREPELNRDKRNKQYACAKAYDIFSNSETVHDYTRDIISTIATPVTQMRNFLELTNLTANMSEIFSMKSRDLLKPMTNALAKYALANVSDKDPETIQETAARASKVVDLINNSCALIRANFENVLWLYKIKLVSDSVWNESEMETLRLTKLCELIDIPVE